MHGAGLGCDSLFLALQSGTHSEDQGLGPRHVAPRLSPPWGRSLHRCPRCWVPVPASIPAGSMAHSSLPARFAEHY